MEEFVSTNVGRILQRRTLLVYDTWPDTSPPAEQVFVGGEFCGQDFEDAWDELVTQER